MSADGYAVCPRCLAAAEKKLAEQAEILANGYGTVSVDEYNEAVKAVNEGLGPEFEEGEYTGTMREDYEFYVRGNTLHVDYGAQCRVCNLTFNLNQEHTIWDGKS